MKRGVINIVEVLILLIIFLAAAAFFASFYLNSINTQSQKIQQRTQESTFLINPPVKVIGTIVIENYTNSESQSAGAKDAVPFACVEETSGNGNWWLAAVYEIKGYAGSIFNSITMSDMVTAVNASSAAGAGAEENLTSVAFGPLNKVVAICYVDGTPKAVYNLTTACDLQTLNKTVINATNWCYHKYKTLNGKSWKVVFVNPFQYLPAGGVGVVVGHIIPYTVVQKGASFSFKIKFAQSYRPNPSTLYLLKQKGELTFANITDWLERVHWAPGAVGLFEAICEGCTFSVG